jgi:chemotaxis response regulator CheB
MKKRATKFKAAEQSDGSGNGEPILPRKVDGFLLVGLGASAGGIQALKEFFENVPENSGIAYVVILHLSPDHDSRLAQVLQSRDKDAR